MVLWMVNVDGADSCLGDGTATECSHFVDGERQDPGRDRPNSSASSNERTGRQGVAAGLAHASAGRPGDVATR